MLRRRAILVLAVGALAVGLVLLGGAAPVCGESLTVFRLEPSTGWVELPPVNAYASATSEGPLAGWSGAAVAVPVTARAILEPDLRKAMLTAVFVPRSAGIRANAANLFVAPLGRRLEWTLVLTVTNPNDIPMTDVKVRDEFGKAFRATLAGRPAGDARIEGDDPRGMLPLSPTLVWDIGELGPGEAARAEVTVVTGRDGQGNQQFSREGIYSIDMGARLTYRLAGQPGARNAASASVIARKDMGALRSEGQPFDVDAGPIVGDGMIHGSDVPSAPGATGHAPQVDARIWRVPASGSTRAIQQPPAPGTHEFAVVAAGITTNVSEAGGKFVVPAGEKAEWEVTVTVNNLWEFGWEWWEVQMVFGAELSVQVISSSVSAPGGVHSLDLSPPGGSPGPVAVTWQWDGGGSALFSPGATAELNLKVSTTDSGGYPVPGEYVFCSGPASDPDKRMILSARAPAGSSWSSMSTHLPGISVVAVGANVALSATRLDWRVREPGTYAALATQISLVGVGRLSIQFSEFGDLARQDGGTDVIDTYYSVQGVGPTGPPAFAWIDAVDLSSADTTVTLDPTAPTTFCLWSRIDVGKDDSSAEYEGKGVITFIVGN